MSQGHAAEIPCGWLVVDKQRGPTSMATTCAVRRFFPKGTKVGHAGTLDPMASGILPMALGHATALIPFLMEQPKTYVFTLRWGSATTTADALGEVTAVSQVRPSPDHIHTIIPSFTGRIVQVPPAYSALKVEGVPAYKRARRGEELHLPGRVVTVSHLELVDAHPQEGTFRATCSSGTYIRSLGRDMATALGTLGHLTMLRRTAVGPFGEECSRHLDFFQKIGDKERRKLIVPPGEVLGFVPKVRLSVEETLAIHQGRCVQKGTFMPCSAAACYCGEELVALARINGEGVVQPFRCFERKEAI